jgi:hypothetical protein
MEEGSGHPSLHSQVSWILYLGMRNEFLDGEFRDENEKAARADEIDKIVDTDFATDRFSHSA